MTEDNLRDRRLATSEARNEAIRRLKKAHPEEYRKYYNEEAEKRGITPVGAARDRKIARLRRELAELLGENNDHDN